MQIARFRDHLSTLLLFLSAVLLSYSLSENARNDVYDIDMHYSVSGGYYCPVNEKECGQWLPYDREQLQSHNGGFWLKVEYQGVPHWKELGPQVLHIESFMSFELFVNGQRLLRNGRVAYGSEREVEGQYKSRALLSPEHFAPGKQTLLFWASADKWQKRHPLYEFQNHLIKKLNATPLQVADVPDFMEKFLALTFSFLTLISVIYFVFAYSVHKNPGYLMFALVFFCFGALGVSHTFLQVANMTYSWHYTFWLISLIVGSLASLALPFSLMVYIKRSDAAVLYLLFISFVILGVAWLPHEAFGYFIGFYSLLFCLVVLNATAQQPSAWQVYTAATCLFALIMLSMSAYWFFPALSLVSLAIFYSSVSENKKVRDSLTQSQLRSRLLSGELARRNLNPHFMVNSLTGLLEIIETNTKESANFIEHLSNEFHLLAKMTNCDLIEFSQEEALCRAHLQIMSYRLCRKFDLQLIGVDRNTKLPPAIFHCLIENAFSHNIFRDEQYTFTISMVKEKNEYKWEMRAPVGDKRKGKTTHHSGIGTEYVKTRLMHVYGDSWTLQSEQVGADWLTAFSYKF